MISRRFQRGYLLITVIVTLFLLATVAVLLSQDSAISANTASSELEAAKAEYAARAGRQHALWKTANNACMGDLDVPTTPLGADSYDATVSGASAGTSYDVAADQDAWIRNDDPTRNNGTSVTNHIRQEAGKVEQVLTRFDVSGITADSQISSAIAWFHLKAGKDHLQGSVSVHEILADWAETTVTWDSFGAAHKTGPVGVVPPQPVGDAWVAINVTGLVQAWVNGQPNHGLLMQTATEGIHTEYTAREDAMNPPRLQVVVGSGGASPATIKASGKLENGVQRKLKDKIATTYQPSTWTALQPDASGTDDSWITAGQTNWSYGAHGTLRVQPGNQRTLLRMNLQGHVPVGARVTEATLELYADQVSTADTIDLHRVDRSWTEGTCFGNCGPDDGATWDTYDGTDSWATAGGDFRPAAASAASPLNAGDWVSWDITELAAKWVSDPSSNYGVMLKGNPGGAVFLSSDDADPALRPRLSIRYACECSSACIAPRGSGNILMVVAEKTWLSDYDQALKSQFEAWGYAVTLISDHDNQNTFDGGFTANDVVFVSESVDTTKVGSKLNASTVGIVNTHGWLNDELGFESADSSNWPVGTSIDVSDATHYITAPFAAGTLDIYDAAMGGLAIGNTKSPDLVSLAEWGSGTGLATLEAGAVTASGGSTEGRRVMLPLGRQSNSNLNYVNDNGWLLVQRAIDWAIGLDQTASRAPIAHWKLDETIGSTAVDSIGGNDGNASNTTWTSGYINGGLQFNSAADSVVVPHADELSITNQLTLAAWINKSDLFGYDAAVVKATTGSDLNYFLGTWENNPVFGFSTSTDNWQGYYATGTSLQTGSWYHLAATFDNAADTVNVYVDGQLAQSFSTTLEPVTNSGDVLLGRSAIGEYWPGVLDDVRIYDVALTAEEIAELAALPGPLAHWKLDNGTGTTAIDSVGGHHGTLVNGPAWTSGTLDGALDFDGVDDYVDLTSDAELTDIFDDGGTVTGWIFPRSWGESENGRILDKATQVSGDREGWMIALRGATPAVQFAQGFTGVRGFWRSQEGTVSLNTWTHFAVVYDASSVDNDAKIYLNGVEQSPLVEIAPTGSIATDAGISLRMGNYAQDTSRTFDGIIDDVRIYDRMLGAAEIAQLATTPSRAPIAHWKLDETSGATAFDSIADNDGQVNGGAIWTTGTIDGGLAVDYTNGEDYIKVNNTPDLENVQEGDYTLAAWFRPDSTPPGVSGDNDANYGILIKPGWHTGIFFTNQNRFGFWQHLDGDINVASTSGNTFTPGSSYHVAATVDRATGLQSLYVNGQLEDTSGFTPGAAAREYGTGTWRIGIANPSASSWGWAADGTIDDVRIYDGVLSATEVSDLFALGGGGGGSGGAGGGGSCDGNFRDNFDTRAANGNNGTLSWATDWIEVGESDGPTSGDIQVMNDQSNYQLRTRDNDNGGEGVEREADLSGAATATLNYDYRRMNLDNSNDYAAVEISANGAAGPWTELTRHSGSGNDSSYQPASHPITDYVSENTRIRFKTSSTMGGTDTVWFDNVEIACSP